jgi:phosphoribosylaminoimidazolecarboxamide formyltransferase/IMP cyclohydrolase
MPGFIFAFMIALISVSDKTGIVEFAQALHSLGITIISTGGTASVLKGAGIPVIKVSDVTQFPEILDGRVKTLHPKIHGGLLAVMNNPEHVKQMQLHGIEKIDLLVVNLYPFEETVSRLAATDDEIIENIDIGGPAMVRAGAKNFEHTCVVVNPKHYSSILEQLSSVGKIPSALRLTLAHEAFAHTAHYDARIAGYLALKVSANFIAETAIPLRLDQHLRYGENPHQTAVLFGTFTKIFQQIHGKELSYNNIVDIDAASKLCLEFSEPTVCIIKHTNPCGVGSGADLVEAWKKAFATDSVSPFGGIVAVNRVVDSSFAQTIHAIFTEVVIAPSFSAEALEVLQRKKDRRLIIVDESLLQYSFGYETRSVAGGYLVQTSDTKLIDDSVFRVVTDRQPSDEENAAMMFAWKVAKHVKSNAIVYALADRTLAIGAGQMSRVDSSRIAVQKAHDAGLSLTGCAVASDAFFPFADGLLKAADAGATCIIQPGGSIRDEEVIRAANEKGLAMVYTGLRHFRH